MLLRPGTEITSKCLESVAPFIDSWVILACQPARRTGGADSITSLLRRSRRTGGADSITSLLRGSRRTGGADSITPPLRGSRRTGGADSITPPLRGSRRTAPVGGNLPPESDELITEILGHLPGKTVHHDFTGYSDACSHAWQSAREMADTVLILEADERIQCLDSGIFLAPGADIGLLEIRTPRFSLRQPRLLRSDITVEFLDSVKGQAGQTVFDDTCIYDTVAHVNILPRRRYDDGIRRTDIPALKDDIARLQCGLDADWAQAASPAGLNILLSIAHSWLESDQADKAAQYFEAIIDQVTDADQTTGNMAEIYWQARYFLAGIHTSQNRIPQAVDLLSACITQDLERLEPFMRLAEIFEVNNEEERALTLMDLAVDVPQPLLARYFEPDIYQYSARLMAAKLCARLDRTDAAIDHAKKLALNQKLPDEIEKQRKALLTEQQDIKRTNSVDGVTPLPDQSLPPTRSGAGAGAEAGAGDRPLRESRRTGEADRITPPLRGSRRAAPVGGNQPSEPAQPDPPSPAPKLTIGMATYDDFHGVYFTIMSIILYHRAALPDIEIVVIDNNPDSSHGEAVAKFCRQTGLVRYIPAAEYKGTTIKERVFAEARGEFVLCVDCHVFLHDGAVGRLLEYCADNPDSIDLLHGPLCYDNIQHISSHMEKRWNKGFFGVWGTDPRAKNGDGEPFDIPLQGMGLFACRKAAWLGFNRKFRGFGGEEGYIHEKFRQKGGRILCLPFLYWSHRFGRPGGAQYVNRWEDRIRNYLIGWDELGMPTTELLDHFSDHINHKAASKANAWFIQEKRGPLWAFDTIFWLSGSDDAWERDCKALENLSIDRITQRIELPDTSDTKTHAIIQAQQRILDLAIRQNLDDIVIINGNHGFAANPRKKLLSVQSKLEDKKTDILATNEFRDDSGPDSDSDSDSPAADSPAATMDHLLIIRNNAFQAAHAIIKAGQPLTLSNLEAHQPDLSIQRV